MVSHHYYTVNSKSIRNLGRGGEDDFGSAFIGDDFAGDGDGGAIVTREVTEFFRIVGEDDAGERTSFIVITEVQKDRSGLGRIRFY